MRKDLLVKCSAFVFVLCIITFTLYKIGAPYSKYYNEKNKIAKVINSPQVGAIVLGSSHAGCIRPMQFGYKTTARFNKGGADLFESIYQGRCFIDEKKTNNLFLSISYFSFYYNNNYESKTGDHPRKEKRIRLYATYPGFDLISCDFNNMLMGKFSPLVTENHWQKVFDALIDETLIKLSFKEEVAAPVKKAKKKRLEKWEIFKNDFINYVSVLANVQRLSRESADSAELKQQLAKLRKAKKKLQRNKKNAKLYMEFIKDKDVTSRPPADFYLDYHGVLRGGRIGGLCKDMINGSDNLDERIYDALDKFLSYAEKKGINVTLISTPVWSSYADNFPEDYKAGMHKNMKDILKRHDVVYLDFSDDAQFRNNSSLFANSDHLNAKGARVLARRIKKALN